MHSISPTSLTMPQGYCLSLPMSFLSIYVVGGQVTYDAKTVVQKYNPKEEFKGWESLQAPASAHRAFGFASFTNFLFIVGGLGKDTGLEPSAKIEV